MKTIDYTLGERKTWRAVPRNAAGGMADLTGASAELRITVAGDLCLRIAGAIDDRGIAFALSPESLDIPSGRYAAQLWIRWPDGQERACGRFVLLNRKGR
ncbi:hypothetical protein H5395_16780 [Paracoccus sp. MC1854]|uniref:hypothetical protein n=1 Tax=Paracoccus sp. MC1854 TaxID=2760306 RepID=UPI0016024384|nr:hypothetical protein [Paracoccus sp. MC1854]MBB1493129.1 hypothetical protein [Paracoccus sp. MC1854]